MMKSHPILKILNSALYTLPSPSNLSTMWNFGSLLGTCLVIQLFTGIFLSMHYSGDISLAFSSVSHIMRDVNYGWLLRIMHANGASFFFIFMYLHVGRGVYYGSYHWKHTWMVGVMILLATMATAFLGYVLPWGQMSFWGATVITNLFSAIPFIGGDLVMWMWGGFAVDNPTLSRFYSLHFMLPFIISGMSAVHLVFLHQTGSSNPLGLNSNYDKVPFHIYFSSKDMLGILLAFFFFLTICIYYPYMMGDPENFIPANSLVTPVHIQPEWYFLMAYAILRSIPNKLGGVVALAMSIIILMVLPFCVSHNYKGNVFNSMNKFFFWIHVNVWSLLTWLGARPVEDPYIFLGMLLSLLYFMFYFIMPFVNYILYNMVFDLKVSMEV